MRTRRVLWTLIGTLTLFIVLGGGVVAALAFLGLRASPTQLLVLDGDARLRMIGLDGQERVLATDASTDLFRYPAAAPDGRSIAYIAQVGADVTLYRLNLISGDRQELYRSQENPPFYLSWSPNGENISFLSNLASGGFGVHMVSARGAQHSDLISTTRGSSYFAWNPEGSMLLLHLGTTSARQGQISTYQPGSTQPAQLRSDPGFFQAPAWSADGSQLFYVAQPPVSGQMTVDLVESVLTRVASDGSNPIVLASEKQAALFFSRAPTSDHLAYTTMNAAGFGVLKVIDPAQGETRVVSRGEEQVAAFFWSPDGEYLAYLTGAPGLGNLPRYTWHVVPRAGGEVRDLASFDPSQAFVGMVSFFDAYAMSFSLWSPDGRRLTYAAEDGVYVIDLPSGKEQRITDGQLGLWVGGK